MLKRLSVVGIIVISLIASYCLFKPKLPVIREGMSKKEVLDLIGYQGEAPDTVIYKRMNVRLIFVKGKLKNPEFL